MKITVELELNQDAYDKHYGPGSEWWAKYGTRQRYDKDLDKYVEEPQEYYCSKPNWAQDMIQETLQESFYDWVQFHDVNSENPFNVKVTTA